MKDALLVSDYCSGDIPKNIQGTWKSLVYLGKNGTFYVEGNRLHVSSSNNHSWTYIVKLKKNRGNYLCIKGHRTEDNKYPDRIKNNTIEILYDNNNKGFYTSMLPPDAGMIE